MPWLCVRLAFAVTAVGLAGPDCLRTCCPACCCAADEAAASVAFFSASSNSMVKAFRSNVCRFRLQPESVVAGMPCFFSIASSDSVCCPLSTGPGAIIACRARKTFSRSYFLYRVPDRDLGCDLTPPVRALAPCLPVEGLGWLGMSGRATARADAGLLEIGATGEPPPPPDLGPYSALR